ncbi:hypothetical protein K7W03_14485 [Sphingobium sp. PNB]|uniref:hypothetical protein n=1 Tax=Sphingobium sp. PNB TaxID=863934 RepID=UPI001CA3BA8C|nr:hypothetical protein [Sphingobium sp. PNB]MCB4860799.1 hypothetical protein [Sphingobium sp. PNB]
MVAHYFETVENTVTGKPVANASVSVLTAPSADGGTELTIYSDEGLTTPVDNPLTTDSTGYFEFYTDQDECCLEISYGGTTRRVIENVQLIGGSVSGDITSLLVRMDQAEAITQDVMVVSLASLADPDADRIIFWDDSASGLAFLTVGTGLSLSGTTLAADDTAIKPTESLVIACSDETTALTTGTAKVTLRMPYAFTLTAVRASVTTAPTGSTLVVDINEGGTSILSTKLSIDASEKTSTTAATAAVISDASLADDAEITIDIDQIGSTVAGAGLKVVLIGHRT